ncbi:MAG: amino acid permease [Candidatus Pacebacteria bacterium]|nr:amino acid permease [Candidatus Paceibacterota bacterium]
MKRLSKDVGLLGVFAVSTGAMISSGIFVLPGIAASRLGPAVVFAYILSGILVVPSMLSNAELATAMPRAGGTYFFVSRSLGTMFGTIDGVGVWLILVFKISIALAGLGAYLGPYLRLPAGVTATLFCLLFMAINWVGAKETAGLQLGMVVGLLAIMLVLVISGFAAMDARNTTPLAPFGWGALLPVTAMLFVSYIGLTKVASVAEEVRNPGRNIPLGMFLSLSVVTVLYGLVVWVVVRVVPPAQLYESITPLSDAGGNVLGTVGMHLLTFAALLAFATTANAGLWSATRYLLAMSRDHVIPHPLSRLSRFGTPKRAILVTGLVIVVIVISASLESIAKMASAFQLLEFALINVAVIVMRESGIESYDPAFKSPLYPYTQVVGILIAVVLIPEMGLLPSIFALGLLSLGIVWNNLYVRHRVARVGAVAQVAQLLAERLLRRDAQALGLDHELREILKEKGLRKEDPFVDIVRRADFIEIPPHADVERVMENGASLLAEHSGISRDLILGALLQRSRLGETPAEAGIALPHVLLDDVHGFYLVAARSKQGMDVPPSDQTIHAIFLLLGDRKDPAQHLRCLAEIARRAENTEFIGAWVGAKSTEDLKELLLSEPVSSSKDE